MQQKFLVVVVMMLSFGLAMPLRASTPFDFGRGFALGQKMSARPARSDSSKQLVARRRRRRRRTPKKPPPPPPPPPPQKDSAKPAATDNSANSGVIMTSRRGPARVDFDDRLIQGQTNKSGAIYIFERKSSDLRSMVRRRKSFREEIFRSIE